MSRIQTYNPDRQTRRINPTKFTLWLFLGSVTMLFAAFTSALVVSRPDMIKNGKWTGFDMPIAFTISTILVIVSSAAMQYAYNMAKKNEIDRNRIALWVTFVFGTGFILSQFIGYIQLIDQGVYLVGNQVNGSFLYVISAVHALHMVGGLAIIVATLISAYRFKVHSKGLLRINLCTTYWHFLGGLWVYLFAILSIYLQ